MFPPHDLHFDAVTMERQLALQKGQRQMELGVPLPGIGLPGWLQPLCARIARLHQRQTAPAPAAKTASRSACRHPVARPVLRCVRCGATTLRRPVRPCASARRRYAKRTAVRG